MVRGAAQGTAQRALILGAGRSDERCAAEAHGEQICTLDHPGDWRGDHRLEQGTRQAPGPGRGYLCGLGWGSVGWNHVMAGELRQRKGPELSPVNRTWWLLRHRVEGREFSVAPRFLIKWVVSGAILLKEAGVWAGE